MISASSLKKVAIFRNVPEGALALITEGAEERYDGAGETIAAEHQPAGALFIVRSGLVRDLWQGDPTPLMLGPGASIGEASPLDGGSIGLTLAAVDRVEVVAIGPTQLKKLAGNHEAAHEFFRNVAMALTARLRMLASAYALAKASASQG